MSLSDFLEQPDVRARFNQEFPKPRFNVKQEILASPPQGGNASLVGTAYDYLLRFYIKYLNPHAQDGGWVAGNALHYFQHIERNDLYEQAAMVIERAKQNYQTFLRDGQFTDELLKSSLLLAKLDAVYRIRYIHENLLAINDIDVQDLRNLVGLLNPEIFPATGNIVLNPSWADASLLVSGADGDLMIDDLLVDIKTLKKLSLGRREFNQLMGYYTLSFIAQKFQPNAIELTRLGIYFSRFGILYQFNVTEVLNPATFPEFLIWFTERAQQYSGFRLI
ncbi:hypothetical protein H6G33_36335 [Calothrix sp. FACHB-1219]|uniref:hypothetical protein n=1 Tax=unclassified Calothrix TaxID=2619626 RepID=UPI0016857CDB|nr:MULTISPECIES: hypothetical protein [unclassified Calothrix]MBD2207781.1 hypothetical protein [Calothrix sp. FACHB-168]MBD2222401.1 hypothetical protein [Calothrix sp. FACHB-1219]